MFNFDLSIFELRYNEVHCHSSKFYPFFSSKIIMASQNLDHCNRKVTHFSKYPTVTVKIIPSLLKFSSLCREYKAFNYTLIAWKIAQYINSVPIKSNETNQTHFKLSNKLLWKVENHLRRSRRIQNGHVTREKPRKNCRMESWEDCITLLF